MTTITITPEKSDSYRAITGNKESTGRTAGEALDALASQLPDNESGTLVIVQNHKADQFFNYAQQTRLTELMRQRAALALSPEDALELESLIEAELNGAERKLCFMQSIHECTLPACLRAHITLASIATLPKRSLIYRLKLNTSCRRRWAAKARLITWLSRVAHAIFINPMQLRLMTSRYKPPSGFFIRALMIGKHTSPSTPKPERFTAQPQQDVLPFRVYVSTSRKHQEQSY